jgi:hypothetical protein
VSHWIRCIISCRKLDAETPCRRRDGWDAINALHAISEWPAGVTVLADIDAFEELQQLAREEISEYRTQKLRTILDNITR